MSSPIDSKEQKIQRSPVEIEAFAAFDDFRNKYDLKKNALPAFEVPASVVTAWKEKTISHKIVQGRLHFRKISL